MSSVRDGVAAFFAVFIYDVNDIDVMVVFFFRNGNDAVDFRDDSVALRLTGFKQFFDTGKTLGNIPCRRNAACVERTHRQLRARFADGLGRDSADRFADIYLAARAQVAAVALSADTVTAVAGKDGTNPDLIVIFSDFFRLVGHDFFINRNDDFARIRVDQGFRRRTAFDSFFQRFNDAVAFDDSRNFYAADIVIAYFYFRYVAGKDAFDSIFCQCRASRADFHAVGINHCRFNGFAKHIIDHRLAKRRAEAFFRSSQRNDFN
ncbi:Uncharacterised protein [uncultured Ruminococcus sp.]|nr:Uncharacterised protein [uncultured Ruminococcus sp.]